MKNADLISYNSDHKKSTNGIRFSSAGLILYKIIFAVERIFQ